MHKIRLYGVRPHVKYFKYFKYFKHTHGRPMLRGRRAILSVGEKKRKTHESGGTIPPEIRSTGRRK